MNDLKPCPFCGGEPKIFVCDGSGSFWNSIETPVLAGLDHFLIRCTKCGIRTKAYLTNRGVYNAWNRRVNDG